MSTWDPATTAQFFDEYGEREWARFEDGRTTAPSLTTHIRMLERFVGDGDGVLDAGCGPGRFTLELQRLGANVTALDISPVQLELLRRRVTNVETVLGDVVDLSTFDDDTFDVTVCYGGPLSYLLDEAERAVAELARVTKPGGHLLVSVMSLGGTAVHYASMIADLVRRDGPQQTLDVIRTQVLPRKPDYGHLAMKLYRWSDVEALLSPYGEVVAGAAAGVMPHVEDGAAWVAEFDAALADDPAMRGCGDHIVGVVRIA
jgi:ubiquinone/menaquinone biosynthesis C-methylase UbiE